jgi:hypothetical protein
MRYSVAAEGDWCERDLPWLRPEKLIPEQARELGISEAEVRQRTRNVMKMKYSWSLPASVSLERKGTRPRPKFLGSSRMRYFGASQPNEFVICLLAISNCS